MVKIFSFLAALLLMCGIVFMSARNRLKSVAEGQAGVAYIETEDGREVEVTDLRPPERTLPPALANKDQLPKANRKEGTAKEWLTKFTLTERSGKQMGSDELKGQPYVAGFFFTNCASDMPETECKGGSVAREVQRPSGSICEHLVRSRSG